MAVNTIVKLQFSSFMDRNVDDVRPHHGATLSAAASAVRFFFATGSVLFLMTDAALKFFDGEVHNYDRRQSVNSAQLREFGYFGDASVSLLYPRR